MNVVKAESIGNPHTKGSGFSRFAIHKKFFAILSYSPGSVNAYCAGFLNTAKNANIIGNCTNSIKQPEAGLYLCSLYNSCIFICIVCGSFLYLVCISFISGCISLILRVDLVCLMLIGNNISLNTIVVSIIAFA